MTDEDMTDSECHLLLDVLALPYDQRQLVVVADNAIVAASRKAEKEERKITAGRQMSWEEVFVKATTFFSTMLFPHTLPIYLAHEIAKSWVKAREDDVPVLLVAQSEAESLGFAPGHPRNKLLYAAHPGMPNCYYSMAEFHRKVFEHKFCEAIRLVMSLGATSMKVECIEGWGHDFASRISAQIPQSTGIEAEAAKSEKNSNHILYGAKLEGSTTPEIPNNLVWLPYEPTWNTVAEGRIKYGLQDFSLNVVYEDDLGINANLKTTIQKAGFEIGGKFEEHKSTIWRISGKFRTRND